MVQISKEKLAAKEDEDTKKAAPVKDEEMKTNKAAEEPDADDKCKKAVAEDEDLSEMDETEKAAYLKLKAKAKKKMVEKGEGSGVNPQEAESRGASTGSTSPNMGVPSTQNVFVPTSGISGKREQSTPMDGLHKSVEPDFQKSPLFVSMSKQLEDMRDVFSKKYDATFKSMNDRMTNLQATLDKMEEFYQKSFIKSPSQEIPAEKKSDEGLSKQLGTGRVQYS